MRKNRKFITNESVATVDEEILLVPKDEELALVVEVKELVVDDSKLILVSDENGLVENSVEGRKVVVVIVVVASTSSNCTFHALTLLARLLNDDDEV